MRNTRPNSTALNQPRLEAALRAFESALGPITEFEGNGEIHRYGFRPALP